MQACQLVRAARVVRVRLDALALQHLAQADAAALVLDQAEIGLAPGRDRLRAAEHRLDERGVLVVPVRHVQLSLYALDQLGHAHLLGPTVQQDQVRGAGLVLLLGVEHAHHDARRAVRAVLLVVRRLGERGVQ